MYYEEDFYNEPSEFEMQVEEFKEGLTKAIKEEFLAEMKRLREENQSLQAIKKEFNQIKSDYQRKENELEYERKNLLSKVRRERLGELMKDFQVLMYRIESKRHELPKCDKCDSKRRIYFKAPSGKEMYEECECSKAKHLYEPEEYVATEFKIKHNGKEMAVHYKEHKERDYDYYTHSTFAEQIYQEGSDFESLSMYRTFFKTKEDCQKFCDYLNAKKENE